MAYTKTTNFLAKDSLLSGDPAKLVKGSELDTEFNAIQTADALNVKRDGTATIAANIPMNNFKLTGLAAGSTAGDSVRYEQFASPPAIGGTTAAAITGTTITASTQFSGPGTGLTGTAASLAIGGNAATATLATTATTATNLAGGGAGQVPYQSASGTTAMAAAGTSTQVLKGGTAPSWGTPYTVATAQASTSGTSIDFTGIPSGVNRIPIMFDGVSTSGAANLRIQIGDSGGVETSGYAGTSGEMTTVVNVQTFTSGFDMYGGAATVTRCGILVLHQLSANLWVIEGQLANSAAASIVSIAGSKTLTGTLDRVRITTSNGTDTFDAGSINISYS